METKESRNWVPQRGVAQVDCKAIHQAKAKRIKNNKGQVFSLLEEAEDIKIISEPWNKVVSQTRPPTKGQRGRTGPLQGHQPVGCNDDGKE